MYKGTFIPRRRIPLQKGQGCLSEILKRTPKSYPDPVLWKWLESFFTLRSTNSCYYSWAHDTAVLVAECAKARLSGQHSRGVQAPYEKTLRKIIIMSSSPDFTFFSQERLQFLNGNCPHHLTKPRLRMWLSYREEKAKDDNASSDGYKCELMHRWAVGCTIVILPAQFSGRNNSFFPSQTYITFSFL